MKKESLECCVGPQFYESREIVDRDVQILCTDANADTFAIK
jgi:hypothetical protein